MAMAICMYMLLLLLLLLLTGGISGVAGLRGDSVVSRMNQVTLR